MKILITGASGFVGSYFVDKYKDKYEIKTFSFLKDDFRALHVKDVDVVLHLSALVHQPKALEEEYIKINIDYTVALARKAKESGVKHFIFMSTIAVYDTSLTYIDENSHLNPSTPYGRSKLEAEKKLQELEDEFFTVSILRPPMVYGSNAPGNIKSLMRLVEHVSILPFGGIDNQRSFVYVGNLCHLVDVVITQKASGIFLASDDEAISTSKLIELIAKAKKKKMYLLHVKMFGVLLKWFKPSLYRRLFCDLVVDNAWSKKVLDFENPYTTEEGIALMVNGLK
ncbi:MAG: NAD-dependent epimerase/dehydratase family protein [Sulfurospirillaceae bacterium]|nr:NAD-dependent epimerase/dehydratase family protein [Sulfurospirillaceae bacterium]MDD2826359.1 NAD-dependent epimerase/dehydratase family protein [Sulfurospirillaceae bacterium]